MGIEVCGGHRRHPPPPACGQVDQLLAVACVLEAFVARAEQVAEVRAAAGKRLSKTNRDALARLDDQIGQVRALIGDLRENAR